MSEVVRDTRMKSNPKKLEDLRLAMRELREWADIEGSLHPYGTSEKQIWREVGEWADGCALKHNLDLNVPVSQPPTSPLEIRGRGKSVSCAAAKPGSIPNAPHELPPTKTP